MYEPDFLLLIRHCLLFRTRHHRVTSGGTSGSHDDSLGLIEFLLNPALRRRGYSVRVLTDSSQTDTDLSAVPDSGACRQNSSGGFLGTPRGLGFATATFATFLGRSYHLQRAEHD